MTRKHKPQTAHKKRHAAPNSKPMKSAAADKAVAAMPNARDKDHAKHAALGNLLEIGKALPKIHRRMLGGET